MTLQRMKAGIVALGIIGVLALATGPRLRAQDATTAYKRTTDDVAMAKKFVGTWKLASWTVRQADGTVRQHRITNALIIYTDSGYMCSAGMDPNRPMWKSITEPSADELASSVGDQGFYGYCSTVEVHAKEGFVLHHVFVDKSPNIVGMTRKRFYTFDGPNRVALKLVALPGQSTSVEQVLIWERTRK